MIAILSYSVPTGRSGWLLFLLFQVVSPYLIVKSYPVDTEGPCRTGYIPAILVEYLLNMLFFKLFEALNGAVTDLPAQRKILQPYLFAVSDHYCTFNHVFQFPYVAGKLKL